MRVCLSGHFSWVTLTCAQKTFFPSFWELVKQGLHRQVSCPSSSPINSVKALKVKNQLTERSVWDVTSTGGLGHTETWPENQYNYGDCWNTILWCYITMYNILQIKTHAWGGAVSSIQIRSEALIKPFNFSKNGRLLSYLKQFINILNITRYIWQQVEYLCWVFHRQQFGFLEIQHTRWTTPSSWPGHNTYLCAEL